VGSPPAGNSCLAANEMFAPVPLFNNTENVGFVPLFDVAMSNLPSPLKSPVTIAVG